MLKKSFFVFPLLGLLSTEVTFASFVGDDEQSGMTLSQMRSMLGEQDPNLYALEEGDFNAICIATFGQPQLSPELKRSKVMAMSEEDQIAAFMAMDGDSDNELANELSNSNVRVEQDLEYEQTAVVDAYLKTLSTKIEGLSKSRVALLNGLERFVLSPEDMSSKIENLTAMNSRRDPQSQQFKAAEQEIKRLRTELVLLKSEQAKLATINGQLEQLKSELEIIKNK